MCTWADVTYNFGSGSTWTVKCSGKSLNNVTGVVINVAKAGDLAALRNANLIYDTDGNPVDYNNKPEEKYNLKKQVFQKDVVVSGTLSEADMNCLYAEGKQQWTFCTAKTLDLSGVNTTATSIFDNISSGWKSLAWCHGGNETAGLVIPSSGSTGGGSASTDPTEPTEPSNPTSSTYQLPNNGNARKHITLSNSFKTNDVCYIHDCGENCDHDLSWILEHANITTDVRFDQVKIRLDAQKKNNNNDNDNKKNNFLEGLKNINAFTIDLTEVTNLYDWSGVNNNYVGNMILPYTVKDPETVISETGYRQTKYNNPISKKIAKQFNLDKLYNVIVVENCVECQEIHIDAYVNKPGFLATGLQYVSALEPTFNKYEPAYFWYNDGIENHNTKGYKYTTKYVTSLKLLGNVFARDIKSTDAANVDINGHLIPCQEYGYQNASIKYRAGQCSCTLAPSKQNPDHKPGVHVNYCEGHEGFSNKTLFDGKITTFDFTEAEFGYKDQNGVFQYYPADMTLSELQYFAVENGSVAHLSLPTSRTQYIIPEAFLKDAWYVRELCIPYNYTEIHRFAFLGKSVDANKGGISHFTTTAATDDEMLSRRKGDLIDYGDKTIAFPSTTEFVGRGSFAGYDGAALIEDVYCLAPKAPICEFFAFDQKTYVGDNYHHKGHLIKKGNYVNANMAMLHFPNTVDEDGRLDRIEMLKYSDMTRKYRLYDETGHYDNVGNILVWPTQQQYNRSFNQALAGVTWKAWNENIDGTDNPENAFSAGTVAGGGYQNATHEYMFPYSLSCNEGKGISEEFQNEYIGFFDGSESKGASGFWSDWDDRMLAKSVAHEQTDRPLTYDWVNYGGWHQFVIAELYDFLLDDPDPDKPEPKSFFNFKRYNKNIWYSICFPFNLTKAQLLKAFGNPEEGEYPYLSTLASVVRDARGPKIKVVMSSNLLKKNLVYDEKCPNTVKYGSDFKPQYTDVNYADDDIVIEANKPYFILPALPAEEIAKAAFLGKDYSRRVETTPVEMKDNKPMFPVPTHVHAVNGTYSSFVDGQDKEVSDTTYAYNYYFVGNYIPEEMEMPEYAYYLAPSKKSNGDDWSSFYINSPKKNGLLWTENSCIVMAKIDDNTSGHSRSKGKLYPVEKSYTYNYKWIATPHNDDIFFAGTANETHAKSSFGIRVEEDYTTSIQLPDDFVISENNKVYNLNGQFVGLDSDNMPKGIYVVGGKKVVVK